MSNSTAIKFTVVIPAYNPGALLREALESVASQTCSAVWTVVVDDGSDDDTEHSAARWLAELGLAGVVLRQANQGISKARNVGISHRRSNTIALLDADDVWLPNHLSTLTRAFSRCPDAVVAFGDSKFFGDPRSRTTPLAKEFALQLSERDLGDKIHIMSRRIFDRLLPGLFIPVSASSFRTDCGDPDPQFETMLKVGEDRYFFLQMARRGQFVFADEQTCCTRRHSGNTTHESKTTWLNENSLLLLAKIRSDPGLALTLSELAVVRSAEEDVATSLLFSASKTSLASYLSALRKVGRMIPLTATLSIRGMARAFRSSITRRRGARQRRRSAP